MPLPEPTAPAVVVGLDCITGLQSARLLARWGVPVIGIAAAASHYCARTRVPERIVEAPMSGEGLVRALEQLANELPEPGHAFLLPCTDAAVLAISRNRDRLAESYRFVLPEHELIQRLMDKVSFAEHAQAQGLPIPPTVILRSRDDAARAATELSFPAVLKPALKTPDWTDNTAVKAYRLLEPAELLPVYDKVAGWNPVLIVQSWIEGGEDALYSCNAYFDRQSRPLATFVARKIRQWPPQTGTSSLGEEVRDDTVLDVSLRLFGSVGYQGLAYLEVKRDVRTGEYGIIEPNLGRPTGRSAIAERGGVELLMTAYCDALGLPLPVRRTQRYGAAKWIYLRHDLQAAAVGVARGELTPAAWARSVSGPTYEAVASTRDPMPFFYDLLHTARSALRRGRALLRR